MTKKRTTFIIILIMVAIACPALAQQDSLTALHGTVTTMQKEPVPFAVVSLEGTPYRVAADGQGRYLLRAPAGQYTVVVKSFGYTPLHVQVQLGTQGTRRNFMLNTYSVQLDQVEVKASALSRVRQSAFNAVAVDTRQLQNTSKTLADALAQAPGVKLRETGGVGSDMSLTLDGFTGKHVKVFVDGVPQEGVGESFSLNNIPAGYAKQIEVYRGVVPVGFGTDALGGVVNVVTAGAVEGWNLDMGYSYGSFNTHKSYVGFSYTTPRSYFIQVNAFQNYSDNSYWVDTPVEQFNPDGTTMLDISETQRVRRFNDNYHNEAVRAKIGVANRSWADRLSLGLAWSHAYKEIQNGVVQKVVFGQKYRQAHTLVPSLEYTKRDLLIKGLSLVVTANYNHNETHNVDTAAYRYNWLGQAKYQNGTLGEQSYQDRLSRDANWNTTATLRYHINTVHNVVMSHTTNSTKRHNSPSAGTVSSQADEFDKVTRKHITGLSYTLSPNQYYNVLLFGKYYQQYNAGPVSASAAGGTDYVMLENTTCAAGYGVAGTWFLPKGLQAKLSYERALRLPTTEELFGDEDLELGTMGLEPERSHNLNFNLSYSMRQGIHSLYAEGSLIYRYITDYIQRRIGTYTGNKTYASYQNHGRVKTMGYTLSADYRCSHWLTVSGSMTQLDMRDDVKTLNQGSQQANLTYGDRIPNQPYLFANAAAELNWKDCVGKGSALSLGYEMGWQHHFPLYAERLGASYSKEFIPTQCSHNLVLSCSFKQGAYNLALECRNITDARLYDNYSLQKPGRAFCAKVRVALGSNNRRGATGGRDGKRHGGHNHR